MKLKVILTVTAFLFLGILGFSQDAEVVNSRSIIEAQYPGGQDALMTFLAENIEYPEEAKTNKEEGTVYVQIAISKDGKVEGGKILRGVSKTLDQVALEVVDKMPNWIPAQENGVNVESNAVLPFRFVLDEK